MGLGSAGTCGEQGSSGHRPEKEEGLVFDVPSSYLGPTVGRVCALEPGKLEDQRYGAGQPWAWGLELA